MFVVSDSIGCVTVTGDITYSLKSSLTLPYVTTILLSESKGFLSLWILYAKDYYVFYYLTELFKLRWSLVVIKKRLNTY